MELSEAAATRFPSLARQYLGEAAGTLLAAVSPSVRLRRAEPCDAGSPASRLGGTALLARGQSWPVTAGGTPLSFIAQVNTSQISAPGGYPPLPADCLLAFFYEAGEQEAWGNDPADRPYWRVTATPRAGAVPADPPAGARFFRAHHVLAERVITIPDQEEPANDELLAASSGPLDRLYQELDSGLLGPRHRMFGWPDLIQSPMQAECQLAAHGIRVAGLSARRDPRVPRLTKGAPAWLLLLQIDTDDHPGWMWGDSGTIYYWIRRQDLQAGRLGHAWMILQSC